jgi:phosphatidylglycerol:prolipoprotein diacylglycerol transferase
MHPWWDALQMDWVHPHRLFEFIAYPVAGLVYRRARRQSGGALPTETTLMVAAAALVGAAFGAQVLAWIQHWPTLLGSEAGSIEAGGRTIVGGILGGWAGVEWAKHASGVRTSTGDAFVPALVVGIAIGRLGCFFSGVEDGTHGVATPLPWGMDLGDGVARHPTALYEIVALMLFAAVLRWVHPVRQQPGDRFRLFVGWYLLWRLLIDAWKPAEWTLVGLSPIQCTCVVGITALTPTLWRILLRWSAHPVEPHVG